MARSIKVVRYKHGIRLYADDLYGHQVVQQYCKRHLLKPLTPVGTKQDVDPEGGDLFYIESESHRITIVHITQEKALLNYLTTQGIHYSIEDKEAYQGNPTVFNKHTLNLIEPEGTKYTWQNSASILIAEEDHNVFEVQTGKGKALKNGTLVRVPGGWRKIEELEVGDTVVGKDGKPTTVLGVYPQGVVDLYDVEFWDGRVIPACGEHLWECFYVNTTEKRRWDVRNTNEMRRLMSMPNPRVYIPLIDAEEMPTADLPIDPYVLGALLGDGSLYNDAVSISKDDADFIEYFASRLSDDMQLGSQHKCTHGVVGTKHGKNSLLEKLRDLDLAGSCSADKFIPSMYFECSIEQRLDLLRGLLDTDGTVGKDGGLVSYCSVSRMLAYGVQRLVHSLGGIARVATKQPHYTYKGERKRGKLAYIVTIRIREPSRLFNLERKKTLTRDDGQYANKLKLRVRSIKPCGSGEATCITVDNEDHLYVAEGYVVTHNTAAAQKGTVLRGVVTSYVTKPAYLGKWVGDIEDGLGLTLDEDFLLVDNVDRLINLVTYGGDPQVKAYLISSFCIDNYIKRWTEDPDEIPDPDQVWRALGVGLVVYDEAHEVFRMQYWSAMALSPYAILDLSATLLPDEPFLKHRYAERFPLESRLSLDYEAYVDVIGLAFTIQDRKIAQRINKQGMYQHHVFESKVMSKKQALNNYFEMLYKILDKWYLQERQEGQKALFMFATRAMCTEFFDFVKARCPDLNVKRYIEGDKYAEAKEADIIISTPGKSGTGVDYVGLVLNVICVSVNASQKSMQMLGRTRDGCIQRWGVRPKVIYPLCTTITKQVIYYNRRRKLLAGRVNSLITMNTGIAI